MENPAAAAPSFQIAPSSSRGKTGRGLLATSNEVVKYLLETYTKDDAMTEVNAEILQFTEPSNTTPTECAEPLRNKVLHCGLSYSKDVLKATFIEELHGSILQSICLFWSATKTIEVITVCVMPGRDEIAARIVVDGEPVQFREAEQTP